MVTTTMPWRKSSYCSEGWCVEVAITGDRVVMRDGKNPHAEVLLLTHAQWDAFILGIKQDDFCIW
jgi:hypothetical protein